MMINYESILPGMGIKTADNMYVVVGTDLSIRNITKQSITLYDTKHKQLVYPSLFSWQRDYHLWTTVPIVEIIPADEVTIQMGANVSQVNMKKGKNFSLKNELAFWYDLYNPSLGKRTPIRIYNAYDLQVDEYLRTSTVDYWLVRPDIDGEAFAQPISACMLSDKLMTGGLLPLNQVLSTEGLDDDKNK